MFHQIDDIFRGLNFYKIENLINIIAGDLSRLQSIERYLRFSTENQLSIHEPILH
jgi:hypothetical protein